MYSLLECDENDDFLEIQQLELHFSSEEHVKKRKAFWDSFFTKFSTNFDEDDTSTDEFVNADVKNKEKWSPLRKSSKSSSNSSTKYSVKTNLTARKSKRNLLKDKLRSYIIKDKLSSTTDDVITENTLHTSTRTQKDDCTSEYHKTDGVQYKSKIKENRKNYLSRCQEQTQNVSTNSQDFDKLRIKYIIEEKLCSDLSVKIFKRFYFRMRQNEEFQYWENLVKEEIHKLLEVLSMEEIELYMKTSLLESVNAIKL